MYLMCGSRYPFTVKFVHRLFVVVSGDGRADRPAVAKSGAGSRHFSLVEDQA
jgi:hypothetical protein